MVFPMAGEHGGARDGAGRKAKAEKFAGQIASAEQRIADRLPQLIDNMLEIADGGYERVEEEWQPAGLVTVGSGEYESKVFPDKPDHELVLVKRKVSIADKDRSANQYLIDRILGKPTQRTELTGEDGSPLFESLTDDERADRAAALLERARARRAGLAPDRQSGDVPGLS